jgi:hypothetical protein
VKCCNGSINDFPFERDNVSTDVLHSLEIRGIRVERVTAHGCSACLDNVRSCYLAIGRNTIAQIAVSGIGVMSEDVYGW